MQIKELVYGGDPSAFDFHATLPGVLGTTLIRDEVVQMREPREKCLLVATGMMEPLHGEELPLDGVVGLIQERAGHGHLGIFQDGIPAHLLLLKPAPHPRSVGRPCRGGNVIGKVAEPLPQGKYPQALALACPVEQRVELGAQGLAHGRRDRSQFLWELEERVAQAVSQAYPGNRVRMLLVVLSKPSVKMPRTR